MRSSEKGQFQGFPAVTSWVLGASIFEYVSVRKINVISKVCIRISSKIVRPMKVNVGGLVNFGLRVSLIKFKVRVQTIENLVLMYLSIKSSYFDLTFKCMPVNKRISDNCGSVWRSKVKIRGQIRHKKLYLQLLLHLSVDDSQSCWTVDA